MARHLPAFLFASALLASVSAGAQTLLPTIPTGTTASRIAVNPVTNRLYVTNYDSNTVSVIDGATNAVVTNVPVGARPTWIAANPETNKIYVSNAGAGTSGPSLMVMSGASNAITSTLIVGDVGWTAINEITNKTYVVRYGQADEVNIILDERYVNTAATRSYQPVSIALNPYTNILYIVHQATGDVVAIDARVDQSVVQDNINNYPPLLCPNGAGGYKPSPGPNDPDPGPCINISDPPTAVTVNPVTDMIYSVSPGTSDQIGVIRGSTKTNPHTVTFLTPPGVSGAAKTIAVNPVANKVYAIFANHIVIVNGADNAMTVIPSTGAVAVGINTSTNTIYVPHSDGTLKVISGATNAVVATLAIPLGASAIAVNPVTNMAYVVTASGVTPVQGASGSATIPLTTTITPLAGDASSSASGTITLNASASGGFAAPRRVYYQIDSLAGPWQLASGSGPYTASFSGLANGSHTIRAFATNALDAMSIMTDVQNNPLVGAMASYTFTVGSTAPATPSVNLASSQNPSTSGQSVTFTASVAGSAGAATGTVSFLDGTTAIAGCASIAMSGGSAQCTLSSLAAGTHSITAQYSGNSSYSAGTSSPISQVVKANASVAVTSSLNPSTAGQSVTFTASVTGPAGVATGTATFLEGAASISGCAGVALSGGAATCATGSLATGSHSISVQYSGNAAYNPGSSSALTQTVNAAASASTNVALASAGAFASASSQYSSAFPASAAINGERAGANWGNGGGWAGASNSGSEWVQIDFPGTSTLDRVVVYTIQDAFSSPSEPTDTMTFSQYGLTGFVVEGWNGAGWVALGTVTGNNLVKRTVTFAPFTTNRIRVRATASPDSWARIIEIEAWGVAAQSNVALASAGAIASASSQYSSGFPASAAINGERAGANWGNGGGWAGASTGSEWLQVDFAGAKSIDHVVVFTIQDSWNAPSEPTDTMTFSRYGLTGFVVEGWNGSGWVALGTVTGNNLVKRTVTFAPFTTSRIRVRTTSSADSWSRIIEVEAWGMPTGQSNVALASAGALASASSQYGPGFPASAAINGERAGANWGNGGGWSGASTGSEWLQVDFAGTKTIDHVVVYTIQDSWSSPSEPTDTMTFSRYGVTGFVVEGWNGSGWATLATVTGNNLVKRTVSFAPYTTSRIRVRTTSSVDSYSRIIEVEAWGS